ncbi:MAG: multidrug efflux SMR transporter [Phycisphaeraceae bacterium]|nr:multidrug efflux SMR transporter [Phycisphaeraceae bacterium]
MLAWIYVVVAGLFEVVWATSMKTTDGWTRLWPSVMTIGAMLVSFFLLAKAMQSLPLGVAYTVWVGIGAIGAALTGWIVLGERLTAPQWACIALIAAGIIGLRLVTPAHMQPPHRAPVGAHS